MGEFEVAIRVVGNLSALLPDMLKHLGGQLASGDRTQTDEVLGFEFMHVEHVCIVQRIPMPVNQGNRQLRRHVLQMAALTRA